ncbi:hypothetical protein E0L36_21815 [Streptomyces sp. AJS327]|uniref:hypothetical protein n=1 Tax=Streptomyces sp. AJS327 TaxID=2545265 RepID=UPI0015DFEC7B|nr:hypothetical protein [Streptomyces sp. AJS327]MBA0053414.1 hypothetical protein [Streptomyces sp. AJS327]
MATAQIPSVGRIVHFVSAIKDPDDSTAAPLPVANLAALITAVNPVPEGATRTARKAAEKNQKVSLTVFAETKVTFRQNVEYDEAGTVPGTWHWPAPMPAEDGA